MNRRTFVIAASLAPVAASTKSATLSTPGLIQYGYDGNIVVTGRRIEVAAANQKSFDVIGSGSCA